MDKEEHILPAVATLSSSPVLGVDSEWEPSFQASFGLGSGSSSPTSILQARTSIGSLDEGRTFGFSLLQVQQCNMHWYRLFCICAGSIQNKCCDF